MQLSLLQWTCVVSITKGKNRIFHLTLWPSRNPCGQTQKKGKTERHISWVVIWTFEISFKWFQSLTCKVKVTPSHSCIHALTDVFIQQICPMLDPGRHSPRCTKPNLWQRNGTWMYMPGGDGPQVTDERELWETCRGAQHPMCPLPWPRGGTRRAFTPPSH